MQLHLRWGGFISSLQDKEFDSVPDRVQNLIFRLSCIEESIDYEHAWELARSISENDTNYLNSPLLDDLRRKTVDVKSADTIRFLCEKNLPLFLRNQALHSASKNGELEIVLYLLEFGGVSVSDRENTPVVVKSDWEDVPNYNTPLVYATERGDFDMANYLFSKWTIEYPNHKELLLEFSIRDGLFNLTKLLIDQQVNFSDSPDLLEKVCRRGSLEMVKYFVEELKIDLSRKNEAFITAAARYLYLPLLKYMIENLGVDIHYREDLVFLMACGKNFEMVKYLMEWGIDIDAVGDMGVDVACHSGQFDIARYLVERGAFVREDVFSELCRGLHERSVEFVSFLLKRGFNPYYAIYSGDTRIVKLVIEEAVKEDLLLVIHVEQNREDMVKLLVENGANVNFRDGLALRTARKLGFSRIEKILLENGANTE